VADCRLYFDLLHPINNTLWVIEHPCYNLAMPDYNSKGKPTISKILADISRQVDDLRVTDPRLENLRSLLYDLSIRVEEIEARLRALETHEITGLYVLRALSIAVFVLIVVYLARYA